MRRAIPLLLVFFLFPTLHAEEGMWPPAQLPEIERDLKALGLRVDPKSLSDLTEHPMNAVVSLGGCTASFVSPEGLVITNHHCAYGAIQYNSTEESNLLETGFLARERSEELFAGPGRRVLVTVEVEDVTGRVVGDLDPELRGRARYQAIEDREKELVAECEKDDGYRCRVASFHGGLEYYRTKQLEIRDVRLVHAPAGAVGKYGGDIDNWMWPRHTGDYSFYRAYVGPDGKPAEHAEENVPYRPKHHLTVTAAGLAPGDFVMVAGYPGRTYRHRLAREVENTITWYYPTRKALFEEWLAILDKETTDRPDAAIKYAGTVSGLNNASKNYGGMLDGFAKSDILERKRGREDELQAWIRRGGESREAYRTALEELEALVARDQATRVRAMYYESMVRRGALMSTARTLYRLGQEKQKPDAEREPDYQERNWDRTRDRMTRMERTLDPLVDRAVWRQFILNYAATPRDQHVAAFDDWFGIDGTSVDEAKLDARLDEMYAGTKLDDLDSRLAWMDAKPKAFGKSDDPFIRMAMHLFDSDMKLEEEEKELDGLLEEARPRYMSALIAFLDSQGKAIYPDANSTLRVTYGTVRGYTPKDAVSYTPFTTLTGLLEKETGEDPFNSPRKLLDRVEEKRYGSYVDDRLGSVPINFLTTLDSTGGNSGSPTLNGRAELVGLLFDGNYESINADWDFNERITRSIHVDMRYVLWVMEYVDDAGHLLEEMGVSIRSTDSGARCWSIRRRGTSAGRCLSTHSVTRGDT